jgi:hypothetical protein
MNRPIVASDPTGHRCEDEAAECNLEKPAHNANYWKAKASSKYGVKFTGNWDTTNAEIIYNALVTMDQKLDGSLKNFSWGVTFNYKFDGKHYGGKTWENGMGVNFHGDTLMNQNIFHEFGHVMDIRSGDYFSNNLSWKAVYTSTGGYVMGGSHYSRNSDGYTEAFLTDPNTGKKVEAEQHTATYNCSRARGWCQSGNTPSEEWADLWANY